MDSVQQHITLAGSLMFQCSAMLLSFPGHIKGGKGSLGTKLHNRVAIKQCVAHSILSFPSGSTRTESWHRQTCSMSACRP